MNKIQYEVKTFISSQIKCLNEIVINVKVSDNQFLPLPVLIDDQFNIEFEITDLNKALANFNNMNVKLAAKYNNNDQVKVSGLIGVDIIQFIKPIKIVKLMNGSAFQLPNGICPFGNILQYLYPNQVTLLLFLNVKFLIITIIILLSRNIQVVLISNLILYLILVQVMKILYLKYFVNQTLNVKLIVISRSRMIM